MNTTTIAAVMTAATALSLAGMAHSQEDMRMPNWGSGVTRDVDEFLIPNFRGSVLRFSPRAAMAATRPLPATAGAPTWVGRGSR